MERQIKEAIRLLKESKHILVITGAGISTSSGIPDFRSPQSGLYANLVPYKLPYPEAIFELDYLQSNPAPFFALMKNLLLGNFKPTTGHRFIKSLEENEKLLRLYTQNIDGLDQKCGIKKLMCCHGSIAKATCLSCRRVYSFEDIYPTIKDDGIPSCACDAHSIIKPDIVFFGEQLPGDYFTYIDEDRHLVDLILVIGSSMVVDPVASIPAQMPHSVPTILINREPNHRYTYNIELLGEIDVFCENLLRSEKSC